MVAINYALIATQISQYKPIIIAVGIFLLFILIAVPILIWAVYFRNRKKYFVWIWEKKVGQTYHVTRMDQLIRKSTNFGREHFYEFKIGKTETIPPNSNQVVRCAGKEYAHYYKFDDHTYIPMDLELLGDKLLKFTPMEYDVDILRIQALDRREQVYKLKKDLWDKLMPVLIIALVVIFIIIVTYLMIKLIGDTSTTITTSIQSYNSNIAVTNDLLGKIVERLG